MEMLRELARGKHIMDLAGMRRQVCACACVCMCVCACMCVCMCVYVCECV